jgi:uncharacterized protein (TIGR02421 family)
MKNKAAANLSVDIEPAIVEVDKALFELIKGINILSFVNPINLHEEQEAFFASHYSRNPEFLYKEHNIDAYALKEQLYRLPVDNISDVDAHQLYRQVINSYADKAEQLASIGSRQFLYNCLRYYGEPSQKDIANANFILHAPAITLAHAQDLDTRYDAAAVKSAFIQALDDYGFDCPVEINSNMVANAVVSRGRVIINSEISVNRLQRDALIHHELGVHMVTSMNAREQPLKLLRNGLPLNTLTQEGLAILSEYFSGNLDVERLRILALRVIAVKMMIDGYDFRHTFLTLLEDYDLDSTLAFKVTARVYRGGGFTKDWLYLRGFRDALKYVSSGEKLDTLLVGKTTFDDSQAIARLISRGVVIPAKHHTQAFLSPKKDCQELNYLISAIK